MGRVLITMLRRTGRLRKCQPGQEPAAKLTSRPFIKKGKTVLPARTVLGTGAFP